MKNICKDTIFVVDFGSQYTHLIARRVRQLNVYSEIVAPEELLEKIKSLHSIKGIILSGGPARVYEKNAPTVNKNIFYYDIPILGICYGHQLIAYLFNGKVEKGEKREYGIAQAIIDYENDILKKLNKKTKVWMSHFDYVTEIGKEFLILAHTKNCKIAAFKHKTKKIYGIQWHPEVIHTQEGEKIFHNFIFNICKCKKNWFPTNLIPNIVNEVKKEVGKNNVIVALSGGVDSSVTTAIASQAIGKKLFAVYVDHGFMREGETEEIAKEFGKFNFNFIKIDAKKEFFDAIKGIKEPERKRKIIGEKFIRIFENVANKVNSKYLLQGTIYPDRIESGARKLSDKIKTHHNVGGLPSHIKFDKIIEPLKDFYKDEVREIGKKLGLSDKIIYRKPFPGPGLAVRIIGEITPKKLDIIRKVDKIVEDVFINTSIYKNLWQIFPVLLDTKSTGVRGDARSYGYTIALRAVESEEAMTANFAKIPYRLLEKISSKITNEVQEITRVVYDITHKPPATIEWE